MQLMLQSSNMLKGLTLMKTQSLGACNGNADIMIAQPLNDNDKNIWQTDRATNANGESDTQQ
jgi:hypothetical protein